MGLSCLLLPTYSNPGGTRKDIITSGPSKFWRNSSHLPQQISQLSQIRDPLSCLWKGKVLPHLVCCRARALDIPHYVLFSSLSKRGSFDEWRLISYQLFCQSDTKYYRPFHQCREKWFNHLDPRVKKGQWSIHEDIALLSAVECLDTKWIEIYREMGGVRT